MQRFIVVLSVALMGAACASAPKEPPPQAVKAGEGAKAGAPKGEASMGLMGAKPKIDAAGLTTALSSEASYKGAGPLWLTFTVSNLSNRPQVFCDYHTPFEGIRNEIFAVQNGAGEVIRYGGMMAKRAAPGPKNFIRLAPGASKSTKVDLRQGYQLPAGTYSVHFKGSGISGLGDSKALSFSVSP